MERESRCLEYKEALTDLRKLARTVVAFANGDGGRIIVGVEDRTRKVVGLSADEIERLWEKVPISLADQIRPPVFPQLFERRVEDKAVLIIQVFPANQKPCFVASEGLENGVYMRVGPHTRRATGEMLTELHLLRSRVSYDEAPMPECPLSELIRGRLPEGLRGDKALYSLGVYRHDAFSGAETPVRASVLMLHPNPERFIPEAYVVVSRMRGDSGRSTVETHELTGPVPDQADNAVATLTEWLARDPRVIGARYVARRSALPIEAVREAVNNALLHRQYSIPGPIKIAMYASRVEVFSPGHFAGPFIPQSLGDGTSYIRNRVMCTIARRMGLIEKRGTGIRLMQDSMAAAGLPAPEFTEGAMWLKVSLALGPVADTKGPLADKDVVMQAFETSPMLTSADVCRLLDVSKATAVALLRQMMNAGLVVRVGKGPSTRYRPA